MVPALTLAMTAVVGAVILSVLLPIYDMTGNLN
jgi:type II secretory pathway component PulF